MTQVKVTGVEALDEERVEAYFNNRRKSGGGDIKDCERRRRDIIITFEEDEAAARVLLKQDHVIDGQPVNVELYDPYAPDDVMEETPYVREGTAVVREGTAVVRVTGLSSDVDDDTLSTYFESRRKSGGGEVVGVERRNQGREALVTFQKMEVAENVVSKTDHRIDGQQINVELYAPHETDNDVTEEVAVKVTGLTAEVGDELLEAYFGSKRKSGGGEVVNLERRKRGRESLIFFEDAETAQRVVSKMGHKIKDQSITVELYNPENDVTEQLPVVKVTDLPPDVDDDMVQSYFENKRKSGGGEVANLERRKRGREAIITFENVEDAQRVASKSHNLKGQPITVEVYEPDDDVTQPVPVVKVTGLTPDIDDEQLENYFGSKRKSGGGDVEKVERRKKGREAIITFEEMEVAQRVADTSSHAIKKQPITVELYDPDDDVTEELPIIKVTGLPPDMENELLETYFESKRKSGGGEVVKLERRKKGREAVVTFEELEVAKRVASKPRHDIKSQQITVELYDPDDDAIVQVPVVKVTGLRADMDDDDLQTYFESKRKSGGGEVVKVERKKRGREALVTFEELEVAERVASKPSHVIKRQPITVELYDPDDDVTDQVPVVKVTGLPPDMDDDTVQAYFENKRKSGGGDVVNFVRKKRGREAIVTFENMEDAERVLGRDKHTLNKAQLTVAVLDEEEEEDDVEDDDEGEEEGAGGGPGGDNVDAETQDSGSEAAATSTVKVTGHDAGLTPDTLSLYMENENKSGGGEVRSVDPLPKENAFLVTFQSPKVAQRVADRGRHSLGGHNLQVRLYTPPPMYENRVLVQGVPEGVSQDTLTLFLENVSGLDTAGVLYGDQPGDLLVSFQGKVDFAKMQETFRKKKLNGQYLSMSRVEVTRCVAVRPVKDQNLITTLELHFENEKRSGGKDVESMEFFPEYQQAVVKFEDHQVAERVSRQRQHVGGQELEVSLHHECLGPSGGSSEPVRYSLPEPLPVADVDSRKATYMEGHTKAAANLKKALDRADADFQLQNGRFVLVCTIPEGTKLTPGVAKEWGRKARSALDNFLKDLAVEEIAVSPKMIQSVLDGGKKSLKDWPRFSLMESPKDKLAVVGPQDDMVEVKKILDAVIADVLRQQNLKTAELAVKSPAKMQLLKAAGVPPELQTRFPQLKERREKAVPGQDDDFIMLEIEDLKASVASLTEEKEKMAVNAKAAEKERDALKDQKTELEQRIDALRASHEKSLSDIKEQVRIQENKVEALEQENRSLRTEKEGSEDEAVQLRQSLEQLRSQAAQLEKSKAQAENSGRELQQQLQTSHSKLADLEQQFKETTAESERFQTQSEDLEKKKTALEQELDTQASQFARMMAAKERERSEAARRAQAAEKSLAATERRLDVLKVERATFQARLESEQKENAQLQSKLENEMRLCEEFRRLLEKEPDKAEAFHQQVAAALERVERGLHQVAEDLSHRQKVSDPDGTFMDRLPPDVKALSIDLQRKIGGHGLKFAQLLLGSSFSLSSEDLEEGGLFFSSRKFWLCIKKWVEASSIAAVPLTSEHLKQACRGLVVDPITLIPITPAHEQVLESNFAYLVENIRVVEVMPYLRRSPLMTADAWSFLLDGRGEGQKVDRLLAVVYSTGEEGYKDLIGAMRDSWNQHVLGIFPQDEAKEEALKRAGLSSENKMAAPNTSNEDGGSAAAVPPEVMDADIGRPSDDEEDDDDSEESDMRNLTNALAEMESRVLARIKEVESSMKDTLANVRRSESSLSKTMVEGVKGVVAEVKSVSEGVLAGIEQVREATRLVEKEIGDVKQETKASSEALEGMMERGFQGVTLKTKKTQEDVLTEIDQVKVIARTVAEEVSSAIQETRAGFQGVTFNVNRASEGVLAGIEQVREATRLVEKEVGDVKQETKASSEALEGMVERGFQGVRMEVNSARDGVLAEIEQVREASRSVERGVNDVKQEVAKSGSEATEIKKCMSALEQEVRRPRGLLDRMFAKRATEHEQASGGREGGEGGGEV